VPARCLVVGVRVTRACGRWARRRPRCSEAGEGRCRYSLRPRRTPRRDIGISFVRRSSRFSQSITDACGLSRGHPGIDPRRCRPLDPLRCDSAPKPSWCATRAIAPASFPVSAARWPTRRTACSFSPAVSLGDDGPFARALSVPLSRLWCHGSSLHPRRGSPGEPVGVIEHRRATLDPAAKTRPERFTKRPTPDRVPTKAWINRPSIQRA